MNPSISLYTLVTFSFLHWVFDFHLQSDEMAKGKSKDNGTLMSHVSVYSIGLVFMLLFNLFFFKTVLAGAIFILLNSVLHFCTDWVTSRASAALWVDQKVHDFFVCIGFDQWIHTICLFGTFVWLNNITFY